MTLLDIDNLSLTIGKTPILKNISFSVNDEESIAICGLSGAGKSQLARCIMRLEPKNASINGRIMLNNIRRDLCQESEKNLCKIRGKDIFLIFQDAADSLTPTKKIGKHIKECLRLKKQKHTKDACLKILKDVTLPADFYYRYPHQMSGGQRQRVLIAMAIALQTKMIIADEPTSALDNIQQHAMLELLHSIKTRHKMTLLLITHDLKIASDYCSKIIFMNKGHIDSICHSRDIYKTHSAQITPLVKQFVACTQAMKKGYKTITSSIKMDEHVLPLINAKDLLIRYKHSHLTSFLTHSSPITISCKEVSLYKGRCLGLVGISGSGKTSIAHALLGLKSIESGTILQEGKSVTPYTNQHSYINAPKHAMIFQEPHNSFNPLYRVIDILNEARYIHKNNDDKKTLHIKFENILTQCNIPKERLYDNITHFSGGEKQRISLARALVAEAPFIVADEALSALDSINRLDMLHLLMQYKENHTIGLLFISHDINALMYIADDIAVMHNGEIVEIADKKTIKDNPKHAFTKTILNYHIQNRQ